MAIFQMTMVLHSVFNIEIKCVFTILKAINCKMMKTEFVVPQDMRECRVHQQHAFMECPQVLSILTESIKE